ncbi:MAG: hypothetical protein GWO07_10470 [Candidatus Dadabacteria bacterium]|nr:hypothetical protein [Candidatus Dadabacteria bacterium]NIS09168.1 hypothetical protein [Candidatus Dadabacteria bacterium]NIY22475.1 hypothetical protein [Candidatus Dadabacteria bacterium]
MSTQEQKSFMRKYSKHFLIYFLFLFVAVNLYLKHSNILIYSNATYDVAMLNIKWGMSPAEILSATGTDVDSVVAVGTMHKNASHKLPIIDYSNKSVVNYYFFNNQLYKVHIKKPIKSYPEDHIAKFMKKIGLIDKEENIVSGLYEGAKYRIEDVKEKVYVYMGFDST